MDNYEQINIFSPGGLSPGLALVFMVMISMSDNKQRSDLSTI